MTERAHHLAELSRRLTGSVRAGAQVRLLPDNQLLLTKDMVRHRTLARRAKAASHVPAGTGYRVYVACRSPEEHAAASATSQRVVGPFDQPVEWVASTMRLRVTEPLLDRDWRLVNRRGHVVTVHVECGSKHVVGEVNAALAEIEAVLLS
jgi:hypothetical protein